MPEIQYPKNPNSDTAFVVQEDGTKNRALMTAPQDTSTLELPSNANSTKGYVTVDGKKQRVILTADIGGGGSSLPDQTGQSGKFLTTDGTDASWSDKPLVNQRVDLDRSIIVQDGYPTRAGDLAIAIGGNSNISASTRYVRIGSGNSTTGGSYSVVIGAGAGPLTKADGVVCIGYNAKGVFNQYSTNGVAVGNSTTIGAPFTVAIGDHARALATGAIQIGGNGSATAVDNRDADTFKVANANGNFEIMSADGTVPTARLTKVNTTATLAVADWSNGSQTVNVTGMTADGVVLVSPTPANQSAYTSAGILCTAQAAGSLTFTCDTVPSADITVTVVML